MRDNKAVYSTVEFDLWAHASRLIPEERYIIETYLDRAGRTLEAGTGGGRIVLAMKELGFTSLHGFDFVPGMIEVARRRDREGAIQFDVQDARCLSYAEASFDQVVYLQQVLCFIDGESDRTRAVREAHRILRPGGVGVFSFLCLESRRGSLAYKPFLAYLRVWRRLSGSERTIQYQPWLRLGGRINFAALRDASPHIYWYRIREAGALLEEVGFRVVAAGTSRQLNGASRMLGSCDELAAEPVDGFLYLVGRK